MINSNSKFSPFEWMLFGVLMYEITLLLDVHAIYSLLLGSFAFSIIFFNTFFRLSYRIPFYGVKRALFFVFIFWNLFIILRSILTTGFSGLSPFNQIGWTSLLTPLIVFVGLKDLSLKSVFKYSYIYGILGLLITILTFKDIFITNLEMTGGEYQNYITIVGMPYVFLFTTSFMLLCFAFVPAKYRFIAFFATSISILIVLFTARRGALFMNLLFLVFTFYLYVFTSKKGSKLIKFLFVLSIIALGLGTFFMYADSAFSLFFTRLGEDSRGAVETAFYNSFKGETLDWIFGRGMNGTYYCILFDDSFVNYRGMIETGYLYIILKGGFVSLFFYLFFLLNSAYIGFFKTNNTLTKAMALYLVAHVIYLLPFGLPSFSLEYIIVWICVAYCQSKIWRMKSDIDIKIYLGLNPIDSKKLKR
jgi:hypothetical protein